MDKWVPTYWAHMQSHRMLSSGIVIYELLFLFFIVVVVVAAAVIVKCNKYSLTHDDIAIYSRCRMVSLSHGMVMIETRLFTLNLIRASRQMNIRSAG